MKNMMQKTLLTFCLFSSLGISLVWAEGPQDQLEDDVKMAVERSKKWRQELEKSAPQRDLASMKAEETKLHQEFESMMANDDDQVWFDKVDNLMK